jgi:hypothetical protein
MAALVFAGYVPSKINNAGSEAIFPERRFVWGSPMLHLSSRNNNHIPTILLYILNN